MSHTREKQLKIQAGVVKRIMKEKLMYEKEATQIENRIEKMKAEGKDEYDIKKMVIFMKNLNLIYRTVIDKSVYI
jgi:tubulin-specific chaperone A